ncbi:hypothetical protein COL5a_012117 [Colletotrichum fioriniae]|uniref:Class II Aldolase and Adducin domain-containing protein n=1 Tax=Colletotrichum fioriniae PJ7 TaxID=1445577 RepID=A0A010S0U8_9PEZI|nr:uncharacterized protein COL516b_002403 [Colletotrichum fioriniae]EXF78168.1 class II Aldolase and Adducin domain-containing protein [Colletotrichum fioriniae PJ7]KAJ0309902.1 hypothetical protein COL516b_002403 [Colletotrichum fioriniae]KAJ0315106.1 hypothetical protein COL5a_012117 [Colletotrichum fioriniae]KAJ3944418.1 hypothetical protein N0V96_005949 [Colletotrichum fioriniae]
MAPSTSVSQIPHADASAVKHTNGNGVLPSSTIAPEKKPGQDKSKTIETKGFPRPQKFDDPYQQRQHLKERLALGFRIFAKNGFDAGVAGHITVRDPVEPQTFWLNPFGVPWPLLKASDLIRVDENGEVVEGGPVRLLNTAAYMIHHAVHEARPEINCVAHSHSLYGQAFSALGRNLDITTQDTCAFYNDVVLYNSFGGIVLGKEEGLRIAAALGDKKAAILQNHGLITCGKSVESCVYWFLSLERCCHQQLLADAAAGGRGHETVKIDQEDAEFTYKSIGSDVAGWFSGKPTFDMMEHESGVAYKM